MRRFSILVIFLFSIIVADDMTLVAPDGSIIFIHRDDFGVPHIVADNEYAV